MNRPPEPMSKHAGDRTGIEVNRLVRMLDAAYAARLPSDREAAVGADLQARIRAYQHPRPRRFFPWLHRPLLAAIALVVTTSMVIAAAGIVNLGKPAAIQSPDAAFPLSGFHRIGKPVLQRHRVQVLFIGTLAAADIRSAVERWAVVKALQQFGALSGVRAVDRNCHSPSVVAGPCSYPTFDWSRARYRSSYVVFDHRDLVGPNNRPYQRLSGRDLALYNRYSRDRRSPFKNDRYDAFNTVLMSANGNTSRALPLVMAGGYLQTASQVLVAGDLEVPGTPVPANPQPYTPLVPLNFSAVHDSLLHGKDPLTSHLVEDVNAEANILTALLCHADRMRPGHVCHRPVIREIVTHVK